MTYYSSLQPAVVSNFSEIKKKLSDVILVSCDQLYGKVSLWSMYSRIRIFLLTRILMKTISRKFNQLCAKTLGESAKGRYYLRLYGNRSIFEKFKWGKLDFCFSNNVAKNIKEHVNQGFLSFWSIFPCTWHIWYKWHLIHFLSA